MSADSFISLVGFVRHEWLSRHCHCAFVSDLRRRVLLSLIYCSHFAHSFVKFEVKRKGNFIGTMAGRFPFDAGHNSGGQPQVCADMITVCLSDWLNVDSDRVDSNDKICILLRAV